MQDLEYFDKYIRKLGDRFATFKSTLMLLNQMKKDPMIVETGCLRQDNDWGGGMSSYLFGEYVKLFGGFFHTVDISAENIKMCEFICFGLPVNTHVEDSVTFLKNWSSDSIDLLYLDSFDYSVDNPQLAKESQQHQLTEIETIWDRLSARSLILIDDCDFMGGGKSRLSEAFLESKGAKNVYRAQQSLWIKGL